jgi:hypothetical protein
MKPHVVANQIFLGYPWDPYKTMWETLVQQLHKKYPVHFLAVGREAGQPATQLLVNIMSALDSSSTAVFDASTGNANVSLEYGYFRATRGETSAYLFIDEDAKLPAGKTPIISDLAGAVANKYKPTDNRLRDALHAMCDRHQYVRRFVKFCGQRKYNGGSRTFLIRMIRQLDGRGSMLRREFLDDLMHETKKSEAHINKYLKELHNAGLLTVSKGNTFSSRVAIGG